MVDFVHDDVIRLVLFPLGDMRLYPAQKTQICSVLGLAEDFDFEDYTNLDFSEYDITNLAEGFSTQDKVDIFNKAFEIASLLYNVDYNRFITLAHCFAFTPSEKESLAFDIFDESKIIDFRFTQYLQKYSLISAAVGFIPFVPVADFFILTPLQIYMCNLIFDLYGVDLDAKSFLHSVLASVGSGFVFRLLAKLGCSLIPGVGWFINAGVAFSGTYIIGRLAREYAVSGGHISKEQIKSIYDDSVEDAKKEWPKFKQYVIMNKDLLVDKLQSFIHKNENNG